MFTSGLDEIEEPCHDSPSLQESAFLLHKGKRILKPLNQYVTCCLTTSRCSGFSGNLVVKVYL